MSTTKQSLNKRQKPGPKPFKKNMSDDDELRALDEMEKEDIAELALDNDEIDESEYMGELDLLEEADTDSPRGGRRHVDRDPDCNRVV